jgi:hypothetical protein
LLGSSGVTILGGLSNVTLINSNNVEVTESNTKYIDGVQVSTSTPKVYVALLTQTGTSAPVATVLENTLSGTLVWSRDAAGDYYATLANEFSSTKTAFFTGGGNESLTVVGGYNSVNNIHVTSRNTAGSLADNLLNYTSVEIRVYP